MGRGGAVQGQRERLGEHRREPTKARAIERKETREHPRNRHTRPCLAAAGGRTQLTPHGTA